MPLPDPAPVLVVDDDELVRGILRRRLQRLNLPVVTASSAEEALELIETMRVGALVLDLHMPGQSGLDLAEFVRLFGAHVTGVPILIFTGASVTPQTREAAARVNADVFLKPDGLQALVDRLTVLADPVTQMLRMEKAASKSENGARDDAPDFKEPES